MTLNYIEYFLTLVFAVTVCIWISAFASLLDISKGIKSSTKGLNICAIITSFKKYKQIIKKKKRKHDKIAFLANTNLHCIKGSISRTLAGSYIRRTYSLLIDVLREYDRKKEKINKLEKLSKTFNILIKQYYHIVSSAAKY